MSLYGPQPAFAALVDAPFAVVRAHRGPLLRVGFAAGALWGLPALPGQLLLALGEGMAVVLPPEAAAVVLPTVQVMGGSLSALASGFSFIALLFGSVAVHAAARAALDGRPLTVRAAFRAALNGRAIGLEILRIGLYFAAYLCCGLPLLVLPIFTSSALPLVLRGDIGPWAALKRSAWLVWRQPGRWSAIGQLVVVWHAVGFHLLALSSLSSLILGGWAAVVVLRAVSGGEVPDPATMFPGWLQALVTLLGAVGYGLSAAYPAVLFTAVSDHLDDAATGRTLAAGLDALGAPRG